LKKWAFYEVVLIGICLVAGLWYLFYYPRTLHKLDLDVSPVYTGAKIDAFKLAKKMTAGQSFVCKNDNLARVEIEIKKFDYRKDRLLFHLRKGAGEPEDIVTVPLTVGSLEGFSISKSFKVNFPVQRDSKNREYYFFIEYLGGGNDLEVVFAGNNRYKKGVMYVNHEPLPENDLIFCTRYLADIQDR
jgi:hypothetical protein